MNNIDNIKCTRFKHLKKVLVSSFCHFIESNEATEYLSLFSPNRSFAPCHSRGTKPPSWDAKVALGQDKQRKLPFKIMYAFCWSCPSANFASQHGGFVPRVWQAAKGLYLSFNHCASSPPAPQITCSVKYGRLWKLETSQSNPFFLIKKHPQSNLNMTVNLIINNNDFKNV